MHKISIIIPSRPQENQVVFLQRAIASVRQQTIVDKFQLTFLVGVDNGRSQNVADIERLGAKCVESRGNSQAAALNAAISALDADYVAFLEDDDQWLPMYLEAAMQCVSMSGFVSSTQMEYDEHGQFLRINDFPTPSGWFMPVSTLNRVGMFSEEYRFHLDNEWLGRLAEQGISRLHMVEATAPVQLPYISQVRPWLANVMTLSGGYCQLVRHSSPYPLVRRLVHSGSGMAQISSNGSLAEVSRIEMDRLGKRFGRIPW